MCPFFTTLVLLAAVVALLYYFLVWNFGYWKKRGVKEAKSYPIAGSFPSQYTQKRNLVYDIDDLYRQYKNDEYFVGVINGRTPQLLVLNADYAHKIFVNDFRSFHDNEFANFVDKKGDAIFANNPFTLTGEEWKERRAEVTPGLTANRVGAVYPVTLDICNSFVNYIKVQSKLATKNGLDAKEVCLRYTCDVVSDCALGVKAQSFSDNPTPIYETIKRVFDQSFGYIFYTVVANLIPQIRKIYMARMFSKEAETFFYSLMQTAIDIRRKAANSKRQDFMSYILQLKEKKNLTIADLTSHSMTFLTDGFETTASVLSHTLLLLGRYPEVQAKLRAEIGTELLSFEELSELPYLDACIHESLRIFSPLLVARKICTEQYEFVNKNGNSVTVYPGQVVIIPVHSLHHDPDFYEQPEVYKPERFFGNDGVKRYREMGAYFAFGDGPRACLGTRFALTQIKAALVEILRNFNIKVNPKTRKDNYLDATFFMALLNGGNYLDFEEIK